MKIVEIPKNSGSKDHGNIIEYFNKTPPEIVCPHFWMLKFGYGCNFNCAYCYLRGTLHGQMKPWFRRRKEIICSLITDFKDKKENTLYNSGEITDSLVNPNLMEKIINKFELQNKHKLLLLTKSSNVSILLTKKRKQTIVSFSLNAPSVSKLWEQGSPSPLQRLEAAKKVYDFGYETRIRIDPMFPIDGWKKDYSEFLNLVLSKLEPTRLTLGTPRGLRKTRMFTKDPTWWQCAFIDNSSEDSSWGKKIALDLRKDMYQNIIDKANELGFKGNLAMCKETPEMWKELGMKVGTYKDKNSSNNWEHCKCNCVL